MLTSTDLRRSLAATPWLAALWLTTACQVIPEDSAAKRDTNLIVANAGSDSGRLGAGASPATGDTTGVPATPADSARTAGAAGDTSGAARDTGRVQLHPAQPRRGGVLFAYAEGLGSPPASCYWKSEPIPCYPTSRGMLATIPLPAEEEPGTYSLLFEQPDRNARDFVVAGRVVVADREFDREIIFLDRERFALLRRGAEIARDACALRQVLATRTSERRWKGAWREPLAGGKSSGYGVERFYYPASDSSRAIRLTPAMRARGRFGVDSAPGGSGAASWRHAGVDIPARRGAPVVAPAGATVAEVGDYVLTGRTLVLDHGQGVLTAYFHLDTVLVRRGDIVRAGAAIARVGESGLATGPHLHYGVYLHGKDVDPAAWRDMPAFARDDAATASR